MLLFGRAFVDGGYRPVIVKQGPKWSQVVFIDASRVRTKKVRGALEVANLHPKVTQKELARKMMCRTNVLGLPMTISKSARKILTEARHA